MREAGPHENFVRLKFRATQKPRWDTPLEIPCDSKMLDVIKEDVEKHQVLFGFPKPGTLLITKTDLFVYQWDNRIKRWVGGNLGSDLRQAQAVLFLGECTHSFKHTDLLDGTTYKVEHGFKLLHGEQVIAVCMERWRPTRQHFDAMFSVWGEDDAESEIQMPAGG